MSFKLFYITELFLYPLKHQKTRGFQMFSGGIERDCGIKRVNMKIQFGLFELTINPANIYLLKVNNRNTRKMCEIC